MTGRDSRALHRHALVIIIVVVVGLSSSCVLPDVSFAGKRCDDERGCLQGLCVDGACYGDVRCAASGDCGAGETCKNGACLTSCDEESPCEAGLRCSTDVCVPATGSDDAGVHDAGPREDAGAVDGGRIDGGDEPDGGRDAGVEDAGSADAGPDDLDAGPQEGFDCEVLDPLSTDLDGDCLPDLVVGAPALPVQDGVDAGPGHPISVVQVFSGEEGGNFALSFQLVNGTARGGLGASVGVDPRPYDESGRRAFVVGEPEPYAGGRGRVYWLYPTDDGYDSVLIGGADENARAGAAVAFGEGSVGSALLVGLPGIVGNTADGAVIAVYPVEVGQAATRTVLPADFATGAAGGPVGAVLAPLHDVDEDGRREVGVSVRGLSVGGVPLGALALSLASDPPQVVESWYPPAGVESFAASLASVGDVDGDGVPDVAFGAPRDDASGAVYVAPSSAPGTYVRLVPGSGMTPDAAFGAAVAAVGDVDGDGKADIAVGAPLHATGAPAKAGCAGLEHAPSDYAGDCAGAIALVRGADIAAAVSAGGDVTPACVTAGASGQRLGTALRGVGRRGTDDPLRLAAGAPGLPDASGIVRIFRLSATAATCALVPGPFFGRAPAPLVGDQFGAALGQ